MNCNLRVQAGPEIKGEVTSPSWENKEKFAASREKCFWTEDTRQKHGYIISSYEPLADLFFLYFNIGPNNNKTNKSCRRTASSPAGYILYCNIFIIKPYNIGHTDLDVFVCKSFCHIDIIIQQIVFKI